MSASDGDGVRQEVRKYLVIFTLLLSLSMVTVGISYLHLSVPVTVFFAVSIAVVQVFFAAGYFMHLISEKRMVLYIVLAMTAIFFAGLLFLPSFEHHDPITGTVHHNVP